MVRKMPCLLSFCGLQLVCRRKKEVDAHSKAEYPHGGSWTSQIEELEHICCTTQATLSSWSEKRRRKHNLDGFYLQDAGAGALNFALGRFVRDISLRYQSSGVIDGKEVVAIGNGEPEHYVRGQKANNVQLLVTNWRTLYWCSL